MKTELAIVGAGPAGMAATNVALAHEVSVTVIDEQRLAGGQFLRQPPAEFRVSNWLRGGAYDAGKSLLADVEGLTGVNWMMQTTVAGILRNADSDSGFELVLDHSAPRADCAKTASNKLSLKADTVLLAPGCFDLPALFPGWNLPGVMAGGGIQAFVKSQQFVPGQRFLLAGSHPLQLIIADQIVQAGGEVAGVLFCQSKARVMALLREPSVVLRNWGKFAETLRVLKRLRKAGVPVKFGQTLVAANGVSQLESVTIAPVGPNGTIQKAVTEQVECDRLGVCFSFVASSELARQAGAAGHWDAHLGGFLAEADLTQQSSIEGLYLAGEITGVAGSEVAALEGQIAGYYLMAHLGRISREQAEAKVSPICRQYQHALEFSQVLARLSWPGHELLNQLMTPSVTLCKCEEVTVEEVTNALQENPHITTASAAKLITRVGMGLCQGRYCELGLTRLIADQRGIPETSLGGFTARFPSKPMAIDRLISDDP